MTDQALINTAENVKGVFADLDDGGLTEEEALNQIREIVGAKKSTIYIITAVSVDPRHPNLFSPSREEEIDIETNEIFEGANGLWEIEDCYEHFWNRLNESWEDDWPEGKERVKVISVRKA